MRMYELMIRGPSKCPSNRRRKMAETTTERMFPPVYRTAMAKMIWSNGRNWMKNAATTFTRASTSWM